MQTIQLQVDDSSVGIVMTLIESLKKDIVKDVKIISDSKPTMDSYFDARKKELHQIRADIKNGDMEMLSQEQYEQEIEQFFEHLEK